PLERLEVRVPDGDHVAAPVAVGLHRPDRLADHQPRVDALDAWKRARLVQGTDGLHDAGRERTGLRGEEADRHGLLKTRRHELVRHLLAERLVHGDLHEIDPDAVPRYLVHLAGGDAGRDLHDEHLVVVRRDEQLRVRDAVVKTDRTDCGDRDTFDFGERVAEERRGVQVRERDAEAGTAGTDAVRRGDEAYTAVARDQA